MSNIGDLGAPIGTKKPDVTEFSEAGEHGRGVGISGGHGVANASNTQSGGNTGFNAGLGGDHASAGIPKSGEHPIADKFMGQTSGDHSAVSGAYQGGSTGDALTGQSNASTVGAGVGPLAENTHPSGHSSHAGAGAAGAGLAAGAIGGAYAGGAANDGLTGQSTASTTGAGVGPLAENTGDQSRAAALGTTAGGAAAAAGASSTQSGVGPSGGAGGHYSSTGGAASQPATTSPLVKEGEATGHYGHADADPSRGQSEPISDPKQLDTGGPYSLVFQESTGKYVHRHELEGQK